MTHSELQELEQLRRIAARVITDPLERAFLDLDRLMESLPPSSTLAILGRAICELKRVHSKSLQG